MVIEERYKPSVVGVNTTIPIPASVVAAGGFLCITSGTVTVVNQTGGTLIAALPVTAGFYYPMPFNLESGNKGTVTTAGGASGVVGFA